MGDDWLSEPLPEDVEDLSHRGLIEFDHARTGDVWVEQDGAVLAARFDIYAGFADYGDAASAVFRRVADEYRGIVKDSD